MSQPIHINICPTVRERGGLAMSSRNMRLTENDRKKAVAIYKALTFAKNNLHPGPLRGIYREMEKILLGFKIDYTSIVDASTLEPVIEWDGQQKLVALIAAFLGEIRLIDNMLLN